MTAAASAMIVNTSPTRMHAELGLHPMTMPTSAPELKTGALMPLSPTRSTGGCQPLTGRVTFGVGCDVVAAASGTPGSPAGGRDLAGLGSGGRDRLAAADGCPAGMVACPWTGRARGRGTTIRCWLALAYHTNSIWGGVCGRIEEGRECV